MDVPPASESKFNLDENELLKKLGGPAKLRTFIKNLMEATGQDASQLDSFVEMGLEMVTLTGDLKSNEPLHRKIMSFKISEQAFDEFYSGNWRKELKKVWPNIQIMKQMTTHLNNLRDEIIY